MTASHVTVSNESGVDCDVDALLALADYLLAALTLHPECELGITLIDEERMSVLHQEWMDLPGPTDVLSFPMDEVRSPADGGTGEPGILGDIMLCPAFATAQAAAAGRSLDEELQFLVVHGTLHLIGLDHATQEEYDAMFARQDALLDGWHRAREAAS